MSKSTFGELSLHVSEIEQNSRNHESRALARAILEIARDLDELREQSAADVEAGTGLGE